MHYIDKYFLKNQSQNFAYILYDDRYYLCVRHCSMPLTLHIHFIISPQNDFKKSVP